MLSFHSIQKMTKVQIRPETAVKLKLKSFKIQAFADPLHHQGFSYPWPDDAVDQQKLGF